MMIDAKLFMSVLEGAHGMRIPEDRAARIAAIADAINTEALRAAAEMPFEAEASQFFRELERED